MSISRIGSNRIQELGNFVRGMSTVGKCLWRFVAKSCDAASCMMHRQRDGGMTLSTVYTPCSGVRSQVSIQYSALTLPARRGPVGVDLGGGGGGGGAAVVVVVVVVVVFAVAEREVVLARSWCSGATGMRRPCCCRCCPRSVWYTPQDIRVARRERG